MPRAGRRSCYRKKCRMLRIEYTQEPQPAVQPTYCGLHNTWANTHHPSSPSPAVDLSTKLLHQTKRQHPRPGPRKPSCTEHATKAADNVPAGLQHHIQHSKVLPTKNGLMPKRTSPKSHVAASRQRSQARQHQHTPHTKHLVCAGLPPSVSKKASIHTGSCAVCIRGHKKPNPTATAAICWLVGAVQQKAQTRIRRGQ